VCLSLVYIYIYRVQDGVSVCSIYRAAPVRKETQASVCLSPAVRKETCNMEPANGFEYCPIDDRIQIMGFILSNGFEYFPIDCSTSSRAPSARRRRRVCMLSKSR
jgi:hypothetical protein